MDIPTFLERNGTFLSSLFSKFEDELVLCVRIQGNDWKIPMVWSADKQQDVIEHWEEYVERIDSECP